MSEDRAPSPRYNHLLLMLAAGLYFWGSSFMLLLPKYLSGLGAREDELGWVIGLPLIPFMLLAPLAGYLCDRLSARRMGIAGIAVAAASSAALLLIEEMGPLVYLLRVLYGAGHAFAYTPIFAIAARSFGTHEKARGIARFTVVVQLGNVFGSLCGALVLEHLSSSAFFVGSALLVGLSLLALSGVRDAPTAAAAGERMGYLALAGHRPLWGGLLVVLVLGGLFGTVLQLSPTYLDALYAQGLTAAPVASYWFLTSALASVVLARVLLAGRVYRPDNGRILSACILGLLLAALAIQLVRGPHSAMLAGCAIGVFYGLLFPAFNALVLMRSPESAQGAVSGFLTMLYEVGFRGFGFLMGPLAEAFGYFVMFYVLAALVLLGFVVFFVLERERRRWWFAAPVRA